jgi:hypothetical protein
MPAVPYVLRLACAAFLASAAAVPARAADGPAVDTPSRAEVEAELPPGAELPGRELYDRFLKNRKRLRTVLEEGRILSSDPAGNPQETRFELRARDYRDREERAVDGVFSKTLVRITGPRDLEHTAYLYIHMDGRPDEQYVYSPGRRRVARANLRGQTIAGTDLSFDDFLVSLDDLEDGDYRRLPDEVVEGVTCYVVEATLKPSAKSRYTKILVWLEPEHYVPLRTRYWDGAGVASKELLSPHARIRDFGGVWVPTESTVLDLLEDTRSKLTIERLDPNPTLADGDFALSELD